VLHVLSLIDMAEKLKLSPFLFFLKLDKESYVVYNSLLIKKFFCNKDTVNKIKKLDLENDKPPSNYLYQERFLIDLDLQEKDEVELLLKKENINFKQPFFKIFYVIVTTGCNFRCKYCYLSSLVSYTPRIMNKETAGRALEYFYRYISKVKDEIPKLVIYGGEPLLNQEVVKFLVYDIRKNIASGRLPFINIILITNGSLLTEEIAEFLKLNQVLVAISLDGPKEINNANRLYANGAGTYDNTVSAINLLNKYGLKPTISCTINSENVSKLKKIIPWMIKKFNIDSLGLNLFAGGDCSNKVIKKLSSNSAREIIKVFEICRKYGIYEDTILRQIKSFVNEKPNIYYCAATGREISIDPEGNLATCPAFLNTEMFPFNMSENPALEQEEEFKRWTLRSPLLNKKCYGCIALGVCGGGCAFNSHKNHKDIYALDEFYCGYAKTITEWMLKDLYKLTKEKVHARSL